jgi:hypothetical protein
VIRGLFRQAVGEGAQGVDGRLPPRPWPGERVAGLRPQPLMLAPVYAKFGMIEEILEIIQGYRTIAARIPRMTYSR